MQRRIILFLAFWLSLFFTSYSFSEQQNIFQSRRNQVIENMAPKSLFIMQTSQEGYRYGFNFQQHSDLFYLTGMKNEGIVLLLSKTGIQNPENNHLANSFLLLYPPTPLANDTSFFPALKDSLKFDCVGSPLDLKKILNNISELDILYTNILEKNQQPGKNILEKRLIKFVEQFPAINFQSPAKVTNSLRRIKSDDEILLMKQAIDITILAQREAIKSMQPGLYEHQIEAIIEFVFKFNGAEQLAFPTIVGAGPNSLNLHYDEGARLIEAGDMVVMDIGCEIKHYCADITRTIPANGKFSPQQKEIYNIVLEANLEIIKNLRPGFTIAAMDSVQRAVIGKYGYEKYIRHTPSHYLGLDVHDVGDWNKPLESGCVVTVEPGIYIAPNPDLAKEYWNIGVRIEDDVLIVQNGCRVLSEALPKTVEQIQTLMKEDGLGKLTF